MRIGRLGTVMLLGCLALSGCASGEAGVLGQSNKASVAQMDVLLQNASESEDEYFSTAGSYTTDVGALRSIGLNVPKGVTLTVASADATGFCLQASGGVTAQSTWHYKSDQQTPLPGTCA
jgi:hypothetical protein